MDVRRVIVRALAFNTKISALILSEFLLPLDLHPFLPYLVIPFFITFNLIWVSQLGDSLESPLSTGLPASCRVHVRPSHRELQAGPL